MSSRTRRRWVVEALECRQVLSALPINTIGVAEGTVPTPGAVAETSVAVAQRNLAENRPSTIFSIAVQPGQSSPLLPRVLFARGPGGVPLHLHPGVQFHPRVSNATLAYARDGRSGPLTAGVTGRHGTTGPFTNLTQLPGDVNGDGHVDIADVKAFVKSFKAFSTDAFYKPSADANHNGFIGHGDAKFLERNLTPLTPRIPLSIDLALAPGEEVKHVTTHVSGGETRNPNITIVGRTTPGAIVFADDELGNYTFSGAALATDSRGNFSFSFKLKDRLTNFEFLAIDPFGQQKIRAFPVIWLKD